jgi:hypothetical protein
MGRKNDGCLFAEQLLPLPKSELVDAVNKEQSPLIRQYRFRRRMPRHQVQRGPVHLSGQQPEVRRLPPTLPANKLDSLPAAPPNQRPNLRRKTPGLNDAGQLLVGEAAEGLVD